MAATIITKHHNNTLHHFSFHGIVNFFLTDLTELQMFWKQIEKFYILIVDFP